MLKSGIVAIVAVVVASAVLSASSATADLAPLGDQFRVDDAGDFGTTQYSRPVARFSDGSFVVVWNKGSSPTDILAQRYDAQGTKLGTAFTISPGPFGTSRYAFAVAGHADKSSVVVWGVADSTSVRAAGQRVDAGGALVGTEFTANTGTADQIRSTDVAVLPGGGFVVVWESTVFGYNSTSRDVFGQRLDASATKIGTEFQVNQFTSGYQINPRVASAADGRFVVVWQSGDPFDSSASPDGAYAAIAARLYDASGAAVTSEFVVNTFTTYAENSPDVAMALDGGFVVVWGTPYGDDAPGGGLGDASVTMRLFDAAAVPRGDEIHLNSYITGDQSSPKIAMDDDGSFVVVWDSQSNYYFTDNRDGSGKGVFGRCFTPTGAPIGGELMVNAYTTESQSVAGVDSDGSGDFVVVWDGAVAVDNGFGIGPEGVAARLMGLSGSSGAAFVVEKFHTGDGFSLGGPVTFKIEVSSFGEPSTGVVVGEVVPNDTAFQPAQSTPGWVCGGTSAGDTCTFDIGDMAQDEIVTLDFVVTVGQGTPFTQVLFNAASVVRDLPGGGGSETACTSPVEDFVRSDIMQAACLTVPGPGCFGLLGFFCNAIPEDDICAFLPGGTGQGTGAPRGAASCPQGGRPPSSPGANLLRLRDREFDGHRGVERLGELLNAHADDLETAVAAMPLLATSFHDELLSVATRLDMWANQGIEPVSTQIRIDKLEGFLDVVYAVAPQPLRDTLDRERARLDIAGWVGLTATQVADDLKHLTCSGFETKLFCGELTGDCAITATDALIILQIAVGTLADAAEADVDGSGATVATDAFRALLIAVGAEPQTDACNL